MKEKTVILSIKVKLQVPDEEDIDDIISDLDYDIISDTGSVIYTEIIDREIL
jgi:hypothetical protein